jgi:protein TonB
MSEFVRFSISSPIRTAGLHPLARALFLSFCVHAILLGVVWQIWSTRQQPVQHILNVELAPPASAMTAPAAAPPAPREIRNDESAAKTETRSNRIVRASAATLLAASVERVDVESSRPKVLKDTPSARAAARSMPPDAPAIDLRILDWLAQYRTYPLAARRARIEGIVQLRVTLMPDGTLTDARIEQSSGHAILDRAALELLSRAARLPDDFGSARGSQIELQLPIVYRMRT